MLLLRPQYVSPVWTRLTLWTIANGQEGLLGGLRRECHSGAVWNELYLRRRFSLLVFSMVIAPSRNTKIVQIGRWEL